jgi:hypothetical protein
MSKRGEESSLELPPRVDEMKPLALRHEVRTNERSSG